MSDDFRFHADELRADPELDRIYGAILINIATRCGQVPDIHPRLLEAVVAAARQIRAAAGTTVEEWRINGPDGPSYAIDQGHPEAEKWTRRVVASQPGRHAERRTVTTYPAVTTEWEQA